MTFDIVKHHFQLVNKEVIETSKRQNSPTQKKSQKKIIINHVPVNDPVKPGSLHPYRNRALELIVHAMLPLISSAEFCPASSQIAFEKEGRQKFGN